MEKKLRDRSISMNAVVLYWLKNWKSIFAMGCVVAVLLGSVQLIRGIKSEHDSDSTDNTTEQTTEDTQDSESTSLSNVDSYKQQYTIAKQQKEQYEERLTELESYLDTSLVMNLDGENVAYSSICYYINNGYKINTSSVLQDRDNIYSIQSAYISGLVKSGADIIKDYYKEEFCEDDVSTILQIDSEENGQFITVIVIGNTQEDVSSIIELIKESINTIHDSVNTSIGENTISIFSEDSGIGANSVLTERQEDVINNLNSLRNGVLTKESEVRNYSDAYIAAVGTSEDIDTSTNKPTAVDVNNIVLEKPKTGVAVIKGIAVGLILGICIMIIYFTIIYGLSGKMQTLKGLENAGEIDFLGTFLLTQKKTEMLEKKKLQKEGLLLNSNLEMMNVKIQERISHIPEINRVVFCSTVKGIDAQIMAVLEYKGYGSDIARKVFDVLGNASDYSSLNSNDAVIIVEQIGKSEWSAIEAEIKELSRKGHNIIGYIAV